MDASALLAKQGWRGTGHGLGSTGHGIARPLLISNKQDVLGVGKKKTQIADQWWMRAYDTGLKELGTGKQTTLASVRQNGVNRGGLYGFFVKGEGLAGTLSDSTVDTELSSANNTSAPSDSSTPATTPEAESTPEPRKSEKKRKHEGDKGDKRKKRKEENVVQSKGKDRASKKKDGRSKQESADEAKPAAVSDPKLLRRAAKKALKLKRARSETESKQVSEDEKAGTSNQPTEATSKPKKGGDKKRANTGKGTESQEEVDRPAAKDMSARKLDKYAAKAAEKGMTVEAYLAKKEGKKEKSKK